MRVLGAWALARARYAVDLFRFFVRIAATLGRGEGRPLVRRATYWQVYFTGAEAVPVVCGVAGLLGALITVQTLGFLSGAEARSVLGPVMQLIVVRELGPLMTALIVIGRSGSAITVELGNMKVGGELELLEGLGIDPVRYVVLPRVVGVTAASLCLCALFDVTASTSGYGTAWLAVGTPPGDFLTFLAAHTTPTDLLVTLVKTTLFGLLVATISTWQGLNTSGATTAVPQATRRSVVHSLVVCVATSVAVSLLFYAGAR